MPGALLAGTANPTPPPPAGGPPAPPQPHPAAHARTQICTLFFFSYVFSVVFNVNNKRALLLVPLPWTYAAINLATGAGMALVSWGVKAAPLPRIDLSVRCLAARRPRVFREPCRVISWVGGVLGRERAAHTRPLPLLSPRQRNLGGHGALCNLGEFYVPGERRAATAS